MSVAVSYLLITAVTLLALFTIVNGLVSSYGDLTDAWTGLEGRVETRAETGIGGPLGQWAGQDPTVKFTVANTGRVPLEQFEDWDLILEIQRDPGLGIAHLVYTDAPAPGANEWTVDGIYRDATALTPETTDPGILNPGEEMVIVANPSPAVVLGTIDRATVSTPNGVAARLMFDIIVTPTPTP